jgi:hypothetical protein
MAKTTAQRVRETEAAKRARGLHEPRSLWVPNDPPALSHMRSEAAKLRDKYEAEFSYDAASGVWVRKGKDDG